MSNPTVVSSTRRFWGIAKYLAKFMPNVTMIVHPIQALVTQDLVWNWGSEHREAMKCVKCLISSTPLLAHFDATKQPVVQSDTPKDSLRVRLTREGIEAVEHCK